MLEEKRDDIVTLLIRKLQGQLRGHMRRKDYAKRKQQRYIHFLRIYVYNALYSLIQRNILLNAK